MSDEVHLWEVRTGARLARIPRASLDLESRLEEWLAADVSILDPGLLVIGRQVETDFSGFIDLLCVDVAGDLVIVELKRDKTPREITAQALDYASWVVNLTHERVTSIAEGYLSADFESAFEAKFGEDLPETLNGDHRVVIVGSLIDASSERIIRYLSGVHGMSINAATFNYFRLEGGRELLARIFLIEPSEVELKTRTLGSSKRRPKLTYNELEVQAEEAGVSELYHQAVTAFGSTLRSYTSTSGIGFQAQIDGSWKSIVTFTPVESRPGELRYRLYKHRYATLANITLEHAETLMPAPEKRQPYLPENPDYAGYEGMLTSTAEVDRLSQPLVTAMSSAQTTTSA
jgi:endonuclease NucS-like protein